MKLSDIYTDDELEDEEETLFHVVSEEALDTEFTPFEIPWSDLADLQAPGGDTTVLRSFHEHADEEQRELVTWKANNFDADRIVVLEGRKVIDGQHHLVAARRLGHGIRAIDLDEATPEETPEP